MADRYWVGGTGNWNDTAKWSATSGGAGGESVPTSADNAYFDGASDSGTAFTVTVNVASTCKDLIIGDGTTVTALDQTMTLAGSSQLDVYGSLYLPATNLTRTYSGKIRFLGATTGKTITTNGVKLTTGGMSFEANGEWTLGSALNVGNIQQHVQGTFNLNGYNLTIEAYAFNNFSAGATLNCGSGTITITEAAGINGGSSNVTINGDTSTIVFSHPSGNMTCSVVTNATFYNITWSSTALASPLITVGASIVVNNNLTFASRAASGFGSFSTNQNITVGGTLTVQSGNTDPTRRIRFVSNTLGTQRTITAAAVSFGSGIDFRDIVAAGVASPFDVSALQGGDCKGNSNITFPAAKTVYRIGTGNFSATQWAATSGGTPAADQFPLAQDTMVFDANTTTGTHTINFNYQLGTLTMTNSTTVTLATGGQIVNFYGDITLSNAVTINGTGTVGFVGRNTQTITSSGRTFTQPLTIDSPSGTVVLADALVSSLDMTLTQGTLDLNNLTATVRRFVFSGGTTTKSIAFGTSSKISVTGNSAAVIDAGSTVANLDNFSYTGTSNFELTYTGGTGVRQILLSNNPSSQLTEAQSLNIRVLGGSDAVAPNRSSLNLSSVRNLIFENAFSGTLGDGTSGGGQGFVVFGDLTLSTNMSFNLTGNQLRFNGTSGTQQFTSNGKTIPLEIQKNAASTLQLVDNAATSTVFTHTAGTVDLNGRTLTVGSYSSSNSNTRAIAFGSNGIINCAGNFTATTGTNLTTSGTGTISMTSASAKTFAGGGRTYPTLNQGGAGTLTITGANTFADITNSNATASQITFPASTVTKVKAFTLAGTSGNLVSLRSSTPGTRFNLTYEP